MRLSTHVMLFCTGSCNFGWWLTGRAVLLLILMRVLLGILPLVAVHESLLVLHHKHLALLLSVSHVMMLILRCACRFHHLTRLEMMLTAWLVSTVTNGIG